MMPGMKARATPAPSGKTRKPKPLARGASRARDRGAAGWTQDPEGVRRNILEVARREFVQNGLSGARVDDIAARTKTSKRMLYYYFGDKEGLYSAVLEDAYKRNRARERNLDLAAMPPAQAMEALAGFTFDYHVDNADFVRLVMVENIHHAKHLKKLTTLHAINMPILDIVRDVYERGVAQGAFRAGLTAMDIHLTMSALSFYNVSNRASIEQVFGYDMGAPDARARRRKHVIEAVARFVAKIGTY